MPVIADLRRAACRFQEAAHFPLLCEDQRIGWLRSEHAKRLMAWPEIFQRNAAGVRIAEWLASVEARTVAIDKVIAILHAEGSVTGWRNERYAVVTAFDAPPLFHIERAAARFFGTTTYAAHANGWCGAGGEREMWLARRAMTKPIDPGMLDNLVGGGMSAGVPPLQTIVRESQEEAGIPEVLARNAVAGGQISLLREVPEGVQAETIFVFDLELPREFRPQNMDGEVAEFRRVPVGELRGLLHGGELTLDASLVALSFLERTAGERNGMTGVKTC